MPEGEFRPVRDAVQLFALLTNISNQQRASDLAVSAEGRREQEFRSNMESAALQRELAREKLGLEREKLQLTREQLKVKAEPSPRDILAKAELARQPAAARATVEGAKMSAALTALGYAIDPRTGTITAEPPTAATTSATKNLAGFYKNYQEAVLDASATTDPTEIKESIRDMAAAFAGFTKIAALQEQEGVKVPGGFSEIMKTLKRGKEAAAAGAAAGALAGAAGATIAGQIGPQLLLPEEAVTVPGAAAVGAITAGTAAGVTATLPEFADMWWLGIREGLGIGE